MACLCLCVWGDVCLFVRLCICMYVKRQHVCIGRCYFLSPFVSSYSHTQTHNPSHQRLMPCRTESLVCCKTENNIHLLCLRTQFNCCVFSCSMVMGVFCCFRWFSASALSRWGFLSSGPMKLFQIINMPALHAQLTPWPRV